MRYKEPESVIKWRAGIKAPKCCHTCDEYDAQGKCMLHWSDPPEEFAATLNACPDWIEEMAF